MKDCRGMKQINEVLICLILWEFQTGSGLYAPPTSFTINGEQYIGIASGTREPITREGVATGISTGNYILFSL